jgi:hypothetical protein
VCPSIRRDSGETLPAPGVSRGLVFAVNLSEPQSGGTVDGVSPLRGFKLSLPVTPGSRRGLEELRRYRGEYPDRLSRRALEEFRR